MIAPWQQDTEYMDILKSNQFNPNKDAQVRVNIMVVAKKLDETIEMSESEFRELLKSMFAEVPSYHLNTVVRLVRQANKPKRMDVLTKRLGGII